MSATATAVEVRERPILFSGPMVKAILEGRKSQTRRVLKFPKPAYDPDASWVKSVHQDGEGNWIGWSVDALDLASFTKQAYPKGGGFECPYGRVGERLWVRETFAPCPGGAEGPLNPTLYRADAMEDYDRLVWKPSIFMPRWASRITLEITNVRVERLQEISEEDAIAEGMQRSERTGMYPSPIGNCDHAVWAFKYGWDSLNAKRGYWWESNPWVWVIEFKKL